MALQGSRQLPAATVPGRLTHPHTKSTKLAQPHCSAVTSLKPCVAVRASSRLSLNRSRPGVTAQVATAAPALTEQGLLELAVDVKGQLLESPAWDARTQCLYFVDCDGRKVFRYDPSSESLVSMDVPGEIGFLALTTDAKILLAALERTIVAVDIEQQEVVKEIARTPEEHGIKGYRFNDGKPSPDGVLIAGRKHQSSEEPGGKRGRMYRLDWEEESGNKLIEVASTAGVQLPNGLAWSRGELYFADSVNHDYDPVSGVLLALQIGYDGIPMTDSEGKLKKRVVYKKSIEDGAVPDGLTVDSEGRIWLAIAKGGVVLCLDPQTGAELHRINMPVKMPTSCTFGGESLDILYITTTELGGGHGAGGIWQYRLPGLKGHAAAYYVQNPDTC